MTPRFVYPPDESAPRPLLWCRDREGREVPTSLPPERIEPLLVEVLRSPRARGGRSS